MSQLDRLTRRFAGAEPGLRLELLLDLADRLPALPERYQSAVAAGTNRVHECQTPVFLFPEVQEGRFALFADVPREAPTVRGFVSLLIRGLNGATLEEVHAVPEDLLDRLKLTELLGMTRTQGLNAIVGRVKRMGESKG
ncbi:MAG: SufE family protein [Gemmatimonadales bacterium]